MTRRWPRIRRGLGPLWVVLALVLTGCGNDDDQTPTSVPTAAGKPTTAPTAAGPTAPAAASPAGAGLSDGSPVAGSTEVTTVGALADRIATAWSGVTTYRVNEITYPGDGATPASMLSGSPAASPATGPTNPAVFAIDEVVLPDRRRRRIFEGQEVVSEIVAIGDKIFAQGEIVQRYVDPALPLDVWVVLLPADLAAGTPLGQVLQGFLTPTGAPLSALPPEQRELPVTSSGQTTVDGRTCDRYEIAQTTQTGERVDVSIAIDASGLPCLIQTSAGGLTTVATYVAFNEPLTIEPPAEVVSLPPTPAAATPSPAGDSTPAG